MNTQQLGTDIAGDVSFVMNGTTLTATYQFKANVVRSNTIAGQYVVTINAGEGIDIDHAEIDIYHGADIGESPVLGLTWDVTELSVTAAGEARFQVNFFKPTLTTPFEAFTCISTDVKRGSITIRRKVPAVN